MAKPPNWSQEELDILYELYPEFGSCDELVEFLPLRNKKAISLKASRLGLKVLNPWNRLRTHSEYALIASSFDIDVIDTYVNDKTEILHKCTKCSKIWNVRPNNIVNGHGCPICTKNIGSFSVKAGNLPEMANLYVIKISYRDGSEFLKIGVTTLDVCKRVSQISTDIINTRNSIEIIKEININNREALILEDKILTDSKVEKFNVIENIGGKSELLTLSSLNRVLEIIDGII